MSRYTFGAISSVILNVYFVSPLLETSIHSCLSTVDPFSMDTNARPLAAAGIIAIAVSPIS